MNKIETDGFLSEQSENGKNPIFEKYIDAFKLSIDLNRFCMEFLNSLKIDWKDKYRLIVNTLILRVVENFQAIFLMLERGMLIPAKVLTRANLETLFILGGLQKKPELLQSYIDQHEDGQKRNLKAALQFKNESLKASVKKINIEELYIKKKEELKDKNLNVLKPKQWAIVAELDDFYNHFYTMYSNSIHSNLSSLNDHVDDMPHQIDISFGPSDADLYEILHCNFYVLLNSIRATALVNQMNMPQKIEKFAIKINKMDRKYIDPIS